MADARTRRDDLQHVIQATFAALGLVEPAPIADGRLHRCHTVTKPHKANGAYIVHMTPVCVVWAKNWETGREKTTVGGTKVSGASSQAGTIAASLRAQELEHRRKRAAEKARYLWKHVFRPASPDNRYLVTKGILPIGVKETQDGSVVLPIYAATRTGIVLVNMQFIEPNSGKKRFLKGGSVRGCFFLLPPSLRSLTLADGPPLLCLAEGYATSVSIHRATGYPVVCAITCENLLSVALLVRAHNPHLPLCLCADLDAPTPYVRDIGGIGLAKARAAAIAVGGTLAVPDALGRVGDFNDLARHSGACAVRRAVNCRWHCQL